MAGTNTEDLEKGLGSPSSTEPARTRNPSAVNPSGARPNSSRDGTTPSDATRSPVSDFRIAIGIHNKKSLTDPSARPVTDRGIYARPVINRGIYRRVFKAERNASRQYKIFATLINSALGLQIVIASALTALGASGAHSRAAVTIFGAINTILAGFLTFLKGSGLPNRLLYVHNEWSKVREYIEQRERDFLLAMDDISLSDEIAVIESMYENVQKDIEANTPDSYTNTSNSKNQKGVQPLPSLARKSGKKTRDAEGKAVDDLQTETHDLEKRARDRVSSDYTG